MYAQMLQERLNSPPDYDAIPGTRDPHRDVDSLATSQTSATHDEPSGGIGPVSLIARLVAYADRVLTSLGDQVANGGEFGPLAETMAVLEGEQKAQPIQMVHDRWV